MKFNDIYDCIWTNNNYYVLKDANTFEIYDDDHNYIKNLSTEKDYNLITYDDKEKSFYFSLVDNNKILHKSDDFETFQSVELNLPMNCVGEIKHISYCKYLNGILLTTNKHIIIFNLANKRCKVLFEAKEEVMDTNDCTGPLGCNVSCKTNLIASICCCKEILVAYRFKNMSYIAKLKNGKLDEIVYKTHDFIKSMFIVRNELWILISDNGCQELINTEIECDCRCSRECDSSCSCGIIDSIASIEKSIARILDSESLKIKAAIDKSDDVNDLVCVNSSVKEVIYYVTILEFILSEKLKTAKNTEKKDC